MYVYIVDARQTLRNLPNQKAPRTGALFFCPDKYRRFATQVDDKRLTNSRMKRILHLSSL